MKVNELRIILTVDNLEEIIKFYRDSLGLATSKEWHEQTGNGIILDAGRASLELIDSRHAATIDEIEVGERVAGPVRLAFKVGNAIDTAGEKLAAAGAIKIADVKQAPWSKVQRMQDPSGMQFTLFETSTLTE
ncbi:MAG TPA: VOC family protein [Chitinophaga sp.]|uniref:VOC family protein n=1 Tax=Chitinophaga sp. TaxID=1869181 RepID=UPI002F92D9E6